ncbi:MAG TPA: tryptophan--tRNA ligase [Chloroflexi bacterium]|nr:tryptophan--tRNA ligase [Chloroflexota bacterium]
MAKKRILTGDRPTGRLHLGHYVGTLANRVRLQDEYECFFIIADLHVLTTRPEKEHLLETHHNARQIVLDYLSLGIDPDKSTIFIQSAIPGTYELNLILEMLISVPRLERVPSIKEMARDARLETLPFGLLGYPVLQAADILLPRAHLVPVAKDNEAHVEVAREAARRFNRLYGQVFPEPQGLIGDVLVGTDGQAKASKSLDNVIYLTDDAATVERKVRGMYTDPQRVRADIPGQVEDNPVFIYHDAFNPDSAEVEDLKARYRRGKVGDVQVKKKLAHAINAFLEPVRERRAHYEAQPGLIEEILYSGNRRMRREAEETMRLVRKAMGLMRVETHFSLPAQNAYSPGLVYC